ncbi:MAG: S41 family peptidase [Candidatus Zixiibacteriota bacterium]
MSRDRRFRISITFLAFFAAGIIWVVGSGEATPQREDAYAQSDAGTDAPIGGRLRRETLYKYTKLMNDISYRIQSHYMDTVNTEEMTYAGIRGMLDVLDPFSVLLERTSYDRLMESTQGKYEGLGMQIDLREDTVTVVAPIEGTPAERIGLMAGDRIIAIDGKSTVGMSTEDAAKMMRGTAGTSVTLTIMRAGLLQPLDYQVERAVIELKSVPYYGMADEANHIGYLRLNKFSQSTDDELKEAIAALENSGAQSLIFDLRSNGGGLLDQAVKVSSLFLEKDKLVVYTQGRDPESQRKYFSTDAPLFSKGPLVVLVDGGTASASEIVSGAIQDWDRGIVVGNTTFGKGLVQQIFTLPETEDVALKLTTARYYVPSGRSIQKPSRSTKHPEFDEEGELIETEPTEEDLYYTNAGRTVYGGGGIVPDVHVDEPTWTPLEVNLWRQNKFFNFAIRYTTEHTDVPREFEVTDAVVNQFRQYLEEMKFEYKTETQVQLEAMRDELNEDTERAEIYAASLDQLESHVQQEKSYEFEKSMPFIKREIKRAILTKQFGQRGFYEGIVLQDDDYVKKAIEILSKKDEYTRLLTPTKEASKS